MVILHLNGRAFTTLLDMNLLREGTPPIEGGKREEYAPRQQYHLQAHGNIIHP